MKILPVLLVPVFAFLLGGCVEGPLISDEEYNAMRGPAPHSPDYSSAVLPQNTTRQIGR
jgi:hypothetical protein